MLTEYFDIDTFGRVRFEEGFEEGKKKERLRFIEKLRKLGVSEEIIAEAVKDDEDE